MRKQFVQRYPATEKQLEIVKRANISPRHLVGQENDTMQFFGRCGAKLQLSEGDAKWVETIGKKMGLIEATVEERIAFKADADRVRKGGGRLSRKYYPKWKPRNGGRK